MISGHIFLQTQTQQIEKIPRSQRHTVETGDSAKSIPTRKSCWKRSPGSGSNLGRPKNPQRLRATPKSRSLRPSGRIGIYIYVYTHISISYVHQCTRTHICTPVRVARGCRSMAVCGNALASAAVGLAGCPAGFGQHVLATVATGHAEARLPQALPCPGQALTEGAHGGPAAELGRRDESRDESRAAIESPRSR